jgi:hypothetical protein
MSALSQLSPDLVAMMVRGVSVNVASRDERMRPSTMRAAAEDDRPVLERYLASMEHAVTFAPAQVFEQTPGPKAGQLMARES